MLAHILSKIFEFPSQILDSLTSINTSKYQIADYSVLEGGLSVEIQYSGSRATFSNLPLELINNKYFIFNLMPSHLIYLGMLYAESLKLSNSQIIPFRYKVLSKYCSKLHEKFNLQKNYCIFLDYQGLNINPYQIPFKCIQRENNQEKILGRFNLSFDELTDKKTIQILKQIYPEDLIRIGYSCVTTLNIPYQRRQ